MTLTLYTPSRAADQTLTLATDLGDSYAEHLVGIARALFAAARAETPVHGTDLDIALTGRRALLELLTAAHHDLTGLARSIRPITPQDLEAHPVSAFGRALHRHPQPPGNLSLTDILLTEPATDAGRAWRDIATHAVLGHHAWTTSSHTRLDPDTAWAGLADIATLAGTFAHLEPGLARTAAAQPDRQDVAKYLRDAANAPLGLAAREVLRLASSGPLPAEGLDRRASVEAVLSAVPSIADLAAGQARVARLLDVSRLRPERLGQLAGIHARSALLVARALPAGNASTPQPFLDLRRRLLEHGRLLAKVTERPGAIAGIEPGDPRPLRQAAETYQRLARDPASLVANVPLLADYTRALAATAPALAGAADRELERSAWVIPDHDHSMTDPTWQYLNPGQQPPAAVVAVRRAAEHAVHLAHAANALPVDQPHTARRVGPVVDHTHAARRAARIGTGGLSPILDRLPAGVARPRNPSQPVHTRRR